MRRTIIVLAERTVAQSQKANGASMILLRRIEIYREKQSETDPLGPDDFTRHEMLQHTIEALEWLAADLGIKVTDSAQRKNDGT